MSGSPQLIAGCHVLRRLPMPRHSPCALLSLNSTTEYLYSAGSLFWFFILELLESRKQLFRLHITSPVKRLSLCFAFLSPLLVKLYFTLDQQKNHSFSIDLNYLFVLLVSYSVFNEHNLLSTACAVGGLKWTRTTDLVLIRHAL